MRWPRALIAGCAVLAVAVLPACEPRLHHYAYVVSQLKPTSLRVYDIDDGHRLVRTVPLPQLEGKVAGMAGSAVTDRLYLTSAGDETGGVLLAYDLRTDAVVWTRTYTPGVDSLCVTPDGSKLYMSSGEHASSQYFFVLDASDGDVLGTVPVGAPQTHNAVCSLDGTRAYLSSIRTPYLTVADTSDDHVIRRVGPFGDSIRPFTINGRNTLAIVNVNRLIGFEVGDITTGQKLWRVTTPGYPYDGSMLNPSHGVALTPDEREVWVVDSQNKKLHVFDVTGLPGAKPTKVATIPLATSPYWITFSLDGRYAYPATGDVIDTTTRQKVFTIVNRASKQVQVDVRGMDPVRVGSRHGLGYVTG